MSSEPRFFLQSSLSNNSEVAEHLTEAATAAKNGIPPTSQHDFAHAEGDFGNPEIGSQTSIYQFDPSSDQHEGGNHVAKRLCVPNSHFLPIQNGKVGEHNSRSSVPLQRSVSCHTLTTRANNNEAFAAFHHNSSTQRLSQPSSWSPMLVRNDLQPPQLPTNVRRGQHSFIQGAASVDHENRLLGPVFPGNTMAQSSYVAQVPLDGEMANEGLLALPMDPSPSFDTFNHGYPAADQVWDDVGVNPQETVDVNCARSWKDNDNANIVPNVQLQQGGDFRPLENLHAARACPAPQVASEPGSNQSASNTKSNSSRFACHFAKRSRYRHHQCYKFGYRNVSRLKFHLNRNHTPNYCCDNCWEVFEEQGPYDQHRIAGCAQKPRPDIITPYQHNLIGARMPSNDEQSWYKVYSIIFPGEPRPDNAYVDLSLPVEDRALVDCLQCVAPSAWKSQLKELPEEVLPHIKALEKFIDEKNGIVYEEVLRSWNTERRAFSHPTDLNSDDPENQRDTAPIASGSASQQQISAYGEPPQQFPPTVGYGGAYTRGAEVSYYGPRIYVQDAEETGVGPVYEPGFDELQGHGQLQAMMQPAHAYYMGESPFSHSSAVDSSSDYFHSEQEQNQQYF